MAKRKSGEGSASPSRKNIKNPQNTELVSLNFRVSKSFRRAFKLAAVNHEISQVKLLMEAFEEWQKNHPTKNK